MQGEEDVDAPISENTTPSVKPEPEPQQDYSNYHSTNIMASPNGKYEVIDHKEPKAETKVPPLDLNNLPPPSAASEVSEQENPKQSEQVSQKNDVDHGSVITESEFSDATPFAFKDINSTGSVLTGLHSKPTHNFDGPTSVPPII